MQARINQAPASDKILDNSHERTDSPPQRPIPEEFERLFREHYALVFRTAFRITGNAMDAEDVLQTLFLRLLRREYTPDLRDGGRRYFHRAAINASLDVVRQRRRNVPLDEGALRAVPDPHPGPDESSHTGELRAGLRAAIGRLHPRAAEIFVLRFLEGYSNREIARMLGASQATIAVLLFRARRHLRKEIYLFLGGAS